MKLINTLVSLLKGSSSSKGNSDVKMQDWLTALCSTEHPDDSIIAYNFGLLETEDGYSMYLNGSKEYDANDPDWATNNDFEPSAKYYPLPRKIYGEMEWDDVLEKVTAELTAFSKTDTFRNSFFGKAKAVTTGFDDGDLVVIK